MGPLSVKFVSPYRIKAGWRAGNVLSCPPQPTRASETRGSGPDPDPVVVSWMDDGTAVQFVCKVPARPGLPCEMGWARKAFASLRPSQSPVSCSEDCREGCAFTMHRVILFLCACVGLLFPGALGGTIHEITSLPGWEGPPPSQMYSGLTSAGTPPNGAGEMFVHWWFVASERNPKTGR